MSASFIRDIEQHKRDIAALYDALMAQSKIIDKLIERIAIIEAKPRPGRPPNGRHSDHRSD
jgi:hypothetical protein